MTGATPVLKTACSLSYKLVSMVVDDLRLSRFDQHIAGSYETHPCGTCCQPVGSSSIISRQQDVLYSDLSE